MNPGFFHLGNVPNKGASHKLEGLLNILGIEEGNLMVAPVSTSWDRVLGWLSHIPPPLGGRHLNLLARRILWLFQHRVLQELVKQVKP
jgi:hypothetical protein